MHPNTALGTLFSLTPVVGKGIIVFCGKIIVLYSSIVGWLKCINRTVRIHVIIWRGKMKFFRKMSKFEQNNWRKGAILGFYTYMLLLFINYIYFLISGSEPFTSVVIFWTGILIAFGYDFILNLKSKKKVKY